MSAPWSTPEQDETAPEDRHAPLRVAGLSVLALGALLCVTSWSVPACRAGAPRDIELVVAAFHGDSGALLTDTLPLPGAQLRFAGRVRQPCTLFLFSFSSLKQLGWYGEGDEESPGAAVKGEFRIMGSWDVSVMPGQAIRYWAVCGPPTLRFQQVVGLALKQIGDGGVDGLAAAGPLQGLPAGTVQTSRLLRSPY